MTRLSLSRRWALAQLAALALPPARAAGTETVDMAVPYPDPPLAAGMPGSVSDRMALWLTERAAGRYQFRAIAMPAQRIDAMIADPAWRGVVMWAHPDWYGDERRERFLWTAPCMADATLVLSHRDRPVEYSGPLSLSGRSLGVIRGFRYPSLEPLMASGMVMREDVATSAQNLRKLRARRIDAALVLQSALRPLRASFPDLDNWAYVAKLPQASYQRALLVSRAVPAVHAFLAESLAQMRQDPRWADL